MTDLVLALMALLLGAVSLAIVLLYRGWKAHRDQITELRAQIATQRIAAITNGAHHAARDVKTAPATEPAPESEPARRKGHLALYLGGGVAAVYLACRDALKNLIRRRPVLTTVATVATVGTAAALALAPISDSAHTSGPTPPATSPDRPVPGPTPRPDPGNGSQMWADDKDAPNALAPDDHRATAVKAQDPGTSPAGPPNSSEPTGTPPQSRPDTPAPGLPPTPHPHMSQPEASIPPPRTGDPEPTTPAPEDDQTGLCVTVPPLLDLCLYATRT
ncbi:hypothetical protein ACH437_23865 [Streptomyces xinghaiensis]|uniref:hypothetical protein n=1 Tax=Streptomyces xinghaiensis TaxID=1038928 RepID=UPI00378B3789